MSSVNYKRLTHWLRIWEEVLKEPKELLFGRSSFLNVVRAALIDLEERYYHRSNKKVERSATSRERELLQLLERAFTEDDLTIDFLRLEYGPEMAELKRLLHEGAYDISQIYLILYHIKDAPSLTLLQQQLQTELLRDADADGTRLSIISSLLLRKVVTKDFLSNWINIQPLCIRSNLPVARLFETGSPLDYV